MSSSRWFLRALRGLLLWGLGGLTLLLLVAALAAWWGLCGSLPQLDGQARVGVGAPVQVLRDERGYVTVDAASRLDGARALGWVHAQERFFQMDLMRRNAAGELAALVGPKAVPLDQAHRLHRFRARAERDLAALPPEHRALLQAYAAGVNEGLAALKVRPFEYGLLRMAPQPWVPADSLLVICTMYFDLQGAQGRDDLAMAALKARVGDDWYAFLTQHSPDWQAAIDDSRVTAVPVPARPWPLQDPRQTAVASGNTPAGIQALTGSRLGEAGLPQDARDIGSNNFAVAGRLTADGSAIVADDMHLSVRVPGIWFKARLQWRDGAVARQVTGVSLPGTPAIVAGSNGHVAWGFTNTTADWTDVIALQLDATGRQYRSPQGWQPLVRHDELIEVAHGPAQHLAVDETEWGPVMAAPFNHYALRWVAHDPQGVNLNLLGLIEAGSVAQALDAAAGAGLPAQNLLVGDTQGHIGWTVAGAVPRRHLADLDLPQDWSTGANAWTGYLGAAEQPRLMDPPGGRLWSANNRLVGGAMLATLGRAGYDIGARGQQIRDDLRARERFDEAALHAIQLDHRALFLQRWRGLLLDRVLSPAFVQANGLQALRAAVQDSADAARPDAVGYTVVRAFRLRVLERLLAPLGQALEADHLKLADLKMAGETPVWALMQAGRTDVLPTGVKDWDGLLQQGLIEARDSLLKGDKGGKSGARLEEQARWGAQNRASFQHPLSAAVPALARFLDLPEDELTGDSHMPRVQRSVHGQSERMVVSPGHEERGILVIPAGQSGHPLSPFYRADHAAWLAGTPLPFLPGPPQHRLSLQP